ncbi:MAG: helix-turn-helix domain-containing protein [Chthoniobacterales bacterium]
MKKNLSKPALDPITERFGQRIRQLRKTRNWSLDALATASGVSRSMLSQIERDQANPTLAVSLRIARAFGIGLSELLETTEASSSITVIRVEDRTYHYRSDNDCRIRTLSPLNLEKDVEFYEVSLRPGGALRSAPHFDGTREFLTVQRGSVKIESGTDSEILSKGDSVNYRADIAHSIINHGKGEAVVFLVDIYQ